MPGSGKNLHAVSSQLIPSAHPTVLDLYFDILPYLNLTGMEIMLLSRLLYNTLRTNLFVVDPPAATKEMVDLENDLQPLQSSGNMAPWRFKEWMNSLLAKKLVTAVGKQWAVNIVGIMQTSFDIPSMVIHKITAYAYAGVRKKAQAHFGEKYDEVVHSIKLDRPIPQGLKHGTVTDTGPAMEKVTKTKIRYNFLSWLATRKRTPLDVYVACCLYQLTVCRGKKSFTSKHCIGTKQLTYDPPMQTEVRLACAPLANKGWFTPRKLRDAVDRLVKAGIILRDGDEWSLSEWSWVEEKPVKLSDLNLQAEAVGSLTEDEIDQTYDNTSEYDPYTRKISGCRYSFKDDNSYPAVNSIKKRMRLEGIEGEEAQCEFMNNVGKYWRAIKQMITNDVYFDTPWTIPGPVMDPSLNMLRYHFYVAVDTLRFFTEAELSDPIGRVRMDVMFSRMSRCGELPVFGPDFKTPAPECSRDEYYSRYKCRNTLKSSERTLFAIEAPPTWKDHYINREQENFVSSSLCENYPDLDITPPWDTDLSDTTKQYIDRIIGPRHQMRNIKGFTRQTADLAEDLVKRIIAHPISIFTYHSDLEDLVKVGTRLLSTATFGKKWIKVISSFLPPHTPQAAIDAQTEEFATRYNEEAFINADLMLSIPDPGHNFQCSLSMRNLERNTKVRINAALDRGDETRLFALRKLVKSRLAMNGTPDVMMRFVKEASWFDIGPTTDSYRIRKLPLFK